MFLQICHIFLQQKVHSRSTFFSTKASHSQFNDTPEPNSLRPLLHNRNYEVRELISESGLITRKTEETGEKPIIIYARRPILFRHRTIRACQPGKWTQTRL